MTDSFPLSVPAQGAEERPSFSPESRFFHSWKDAILLADPIWFGNGTREGVDEAMNKWELAPRIQSILQGLHTLTRDQQLFLAAVVSVYCKESGKKLLERSGFVGLADLGTLDIHRRCAIANLLLNYRPS